MASPRQLLPAGKKGRRRQLTAAWAAVATAPVLFSHCILQIRAGRVQYLACTSVSLLLCQLLAASQLAASQGPGLATLQPRALGMCAPVCCFFLWFCNARNRKNCGHALRPALVLAGLDCREHSGSGFGWLVGVAQLGKRSFGVAWSVMVAVILISHCSGQPGRARGAQRPACSVRQSPAHASMRLLCGEHWRGICSTIDL